MGQGKYRIQGVRVFVYSPPRLSDLGEPPNSECGRGPVVMNLMCLQTSVMQDLYASFEDGARPVEEFFTALRALRCTWPTGGKLMIQVKAGKPEQTKTWFSHQLVRSFSLLPDRSVPGLLTTFVVHRRSKVNHWISLLSCTQGVLRCTSCNLLIYRTMSSLCSFRNQRLSLLLLQRRRVGLGAGAVRNRSPRWTSI